MHKLRYPAVAGLLALSLYLFPVVPQTLLNLNMVNYKVVRDPGNVPAFKEAKEPHGGENVLPLQVQQMLRLLRGHKVTSYRYSFLIGRNEEIKQRLLEGAYPLKVSETAHFLISTIAEKVPAGSQIIGSEGEILLVYCP